MPKTQTFVPHLRGSVWTCMVERSCFGYNIAFTNDSQDFQGMYTVCTIQGA